MDDRWILLILMAGTAVSLWISHLIAKKDFLSTFLWGMAGAIPGATLLQGESISSSYVLLIIPLVALALWRGMIVRKRAQSTHSV